MSVYYDGRMTVRGNADILDKFVKYFEEEYDDDEFSLGSIKRGYPRDNLQMYYVNENCYYIGGHDNRFYIGIDGLSRVFPTLKFEYIMVCDDGVSCSSYEVCLNGKSVDYAKGNSLAFGGYGDRAEKCPLCNTGIRYESELCGECYELRRVMNDYLHEVRISFNRGTLNISL